MTQVALNNSMNYEIVLSQLREARNKGLTVPVVLMGKWFQLILVVVPDETQRLLQSTFRIR